MLVSEKSLSYHNTFQILQYANVHYLFSKGSHGIQNSLNLLDPPQEKVKVGGLRFFCQKVLLARLALAGVLKLDFQEGSQLSLIRWPMYLNFCMDSVIYPEHVFSFWEFRVWVHARQRMPCEQPPIKILASESLMSFPGRQHFTQHSHHSLLEELNASCVTPPGGTLGSLCLLPSRLHPVCLSLC